MPNSIFCANQVLRGRVFLVSIQKTAPQNRTGRNSISDSSPMEGFITLNVLTIIKKCRGYAFKHKENSIFAKSGWQITPPESFCYGKW